MNTTPSETSNPGTSAAADPRREAEWVRRARAGEQEAFGELVKTYSSRVYAVAYRMMGNEHDAREVAQQAWVKSWQRLPGFQADSQFFTWLYRIIMNTALDAIRARKRNREVSVDDTPPGEEPQETRWPAATEETPDRELARQEFREAFARALESLSPDHRAALVLREVDGRSYQEIADILKCRIGTVMSRIFYARKQLQEKLKDILP